MRIVIVEDEAPIRAGMEKILKKLSSSYVLAGKACDGLEGLEVIRREKPDVVIMDIRMPDMDGYEATKRIRHSKHPDHASIMIIATTANAFADDVKTTLASGMNAHLSKPVDLDTLCALLQSMQL